MKLNVKERINLMQILPAEANFVTFKILADLRAELSFSEKEIKDFKIAQQLDEQGRGRITWDDKREKGKEVFFGPQALLIIKTALQKIDKDGRVTIDNVSLFEKFQPEVGLEVKIEKEKEEVKRKS
mgnify:CR=1 FL=1